MAPSPPLPPPGPDHYAARRARWLASPTPRAPPRHTSPSHARLERLLSRPELPHSDRVWTHGIDKVWQGLIDGKKLKHRLPMSLVIKVIHAGWLRDPKTWPAGAAVPDSDDPSAVPLSSASHPIAAKTGGST